MCERSCQFSLSNLNEDKTREKDTQSHLDLVKLIFKGGETGVCSKSQLSASSQYFRALFYGSFQENGKDEIQLPQVDCGLFMDALRIAWSENSKISSFSNDEIWDIMELSDMLALEFSAKNCDRILSSRLNANNCIEVCGLADTFSRQNLVRDAVYVILDNWIGIDIEQFVNFKILKPNNIFLKHNELSNELPTNKTHATIPMELLNTRIPRLAFQHSESLEGLLSGFIISHQFYFVGGFGYRPQSKCYKINSDDFVRFVEADSDECSSEQGTEYTSVEDFPDKRNLEDYRTTCVGTDIYVTGGFNYEKMEATHITWRYSTRENNWQQVAPMKHPRLMHCCSTLGNRIYVCGGYDGNMVHNTAECYDTLFDKWIALPNMHIGVGNAACTSHGISIYVVCGQYGVKSINTTKQVQQFNTVSNQWTLPTEYDSPVFSPLSEYGMTCISLYDEIIVLGGQTTRVDAYNVETKQWRRLSDMKRRRMNVSCIKYRGRILAAGGWDYSSGEYYNTVEVYCNATDSWDVLSARLPVAAKNLGFCYIFDVEKCKPPNLC